MKIPQSSVSPTRFTGFFASASFLSVKTPPSTKPTAPIIFTVYKNGYAKAQSSQTFTAVAKQYSISATPTSTSINAQTQYHVSFFLADAIKPTGYI